MYMYECRKKKIESKIKEKQLKKKIEIQRVITMTISSKKGCTGWLYATRRPTDL